MNYLRWIDDEVLVNNVKQLIANVEKGQEQAEKNFSRNGLDPFSVIFNAAFFGGDYSAWEQREVYRQKEKSLANAIGGFHQGILSSVGTWRSPSRDKATFDLCNDEESIIAEVKNKFNTVKFSDNKNYYNEFKDNVTEKSSKYCGYTAYMVHIIPKPGELGIRPFAPSNNRTSERMPEHELIKKVDGRTFYAMVTKEQDALKQLLSVLPYILETCRSRGLDSSIVQYTESLFDSTYVSS